MLLTDITKIIRVLLAAFETVASQDDLTQRRIDQIGQVIGAVEDVAETEEKPDATVAEYNVPACQDTKLKNLSYILLPFLSAYAAIRYC